MTTLSTARVRARLTSMTLALLIGLPIMAAPAMASGGLFQAYEAIPIPSEADAVAVGDVTGDGRSDIVVTTGYDFDPANDFRLLVLAQGPDGLIQPPVSYATAGSYTQRPGSVAIGDITGDGLADVVVGLDRYGIQVFPGLPDGTLGSAAFTATTDSTRIRVGQLGGDDRLDVVGIGWDSDTVSVFRNTDGALGSAQVYPAVHNGWDDLELGDVNGDARTDIVVMSGQGFGPNLSILHQLADGSFGPAVEHSVYPQANTQGVGVGDTNGDGRADVVASYGGNSPSSRINLWVQLADGTLDFPVTHGSYDIPEPVELADLDLDGRADVVTLHGGWNRAGVYLGRSSGTLQDEQLYEIPYASHYSVHGLALGDVSGDGRPDIVAADYNHGIIVLRNTAAFQPTEPAAPTLVSADAGEGRVALTWSPPTNDGGSPLTNYLAEAQPGGAYCYVSALECTISGLENGATYTFTVRAGNEVGLGPRSNALTATPEAVGVPPGPPILLVADPADGRVTLTWTEPADDGGSPIIDYVAEAEPGGATCIVSGLGCSIGGLQNGTTYTFTVRAANSNGLGAASNALTATPEPPGLPPSAPRSLAASPNLSNGVGLTWAAPASAGTSPITAYRVYRGAPGGVLILHATLSDTLSFVDTAVVNGGQYAYQVSAVNAVGEGPRSAQVVAQRGTAPSAPRTLTATAGAKAITLKWAAPTSTGGSPITGYRIFRSTSSGTETFLFAVGAGSTSFADTALAKRTRYYYRVTAVNALGESVYSNEVTAVSK